MTKKDTPARAGETTLIGENLVLNSIVDRSANRPMVDSLVEGPVILVERSSVYVDLAPFGTGIIYGREFINAKDVINKININFLMNSKLLIEFFSYFLKNK